MEAAREEAMAADSAARSSTKAWKDADALKRRKLDVMNTALQAKQKQEAEWKMEDASAKGEITELVPRINAMKAQIAKLQAELSRAEARRQELQEKREANRATRKNGRKESH